MELTNSLLMRIISQPRLHINTYSQYCLRYRIERYLTSINTPTMGYSLYNDIKILVSHANVTYRYKSNNTMIKKAKYLSISKKQHLKYYRQENYDRRCLEIEPGNRPPCINFNICLKNKKLFLSEHCYMPEY